ncbi:MAG: nitrophenyl compound nitroreductase subunit ArsF family protein [Dehalococcoidia bacterium]
MTKATRNKGKQNQAPKGKVTRILWIVVPIVVVALTTWLILAYGTSSATPPASGNSSGPADRVDVVYFHPTRRCYSCRWLEAGTNYTVNTYFVGELASGKLTFQVINIDDEANSDIVQKYRAFTSMLFINTVKDGIDHIEHATELYPLIYNEEAFVTAFKGKIEKCLNGET